MHEREAAALTERPDVTTMKEISADDEAVSYHEIKKIKPMYYCSLPGGGESGPKDTIKRTEKEPVAHELDWAQRVFS